MALLPTGFGKSILYQSFVIAKTFANTASIVVVVPLRSIIEDHLQSNDFGLLKSSCLREDLKIISRRHWCQQVQLNFRIRETNFVGRIHRRMLKYDINNSFPVVLHHVLNYTSGVCVVDFFYSGPRWKIQMHHNFYRFWLFREARNNAQAWWFFLFAPNVLVRSLNNNGELLSISCHV